MASEPATVTGLLQVVERGDRGALDALFPLAYDELNAAVQSAIASFRVFIVTSFLAGL